MCIFVIYLLAFAGLYQIETGRVTWGKYKKEKCGAIGKQTESTETTGKQTENAESIKWDRADGNIY